MKGSTRLLTVLLGIIIIVSIWIVLSPQEKALHCLVGGTMRPVMEELAKRYETKTGKKVDIDYKGSGELLIRIETTGKGDLYVCHDPFLGVLMKKRLGVEGWTVASITPMIAVRKGNPKNIKGLADLARPGIRVILSHPVYSTCGWINEVMFKKAGLKEKINANIVSRTKGGGEAATKVGLGTADAAIVWNAVIHLRRDKLDMVDIKKEWRPQRGVDAVTSATYGKIDMDYVRVTIATLKCSKQPKAAKAFAEFVASPENRKVFKEFGFSPADPSRGDKVEAPQKLGDALFIHCGAGLRTALDELKKRFENDTGREVALTYGGASILLGQIELTRKGDVYIPGDADYIELARKKGLITASKSICCFVPVIMVQKGNPKKITSLADFTRPSLKIGLGEERACAVGRLMPLLFKKASVNYAAVKKNLVCATPTVNQLAMAVSLGTLDAVIVWDAEAVKYAGKTEVIAITPPHNIIVKVAAGILSLSKQPEAARAFLNYLVTDNARAIFKKHGFSPVVGPS